MTRTASLFPAAAGAIGGTPEKNGGLDRHYSTTILGAKLPRLGLDGALEVARASAEHSHGGLTAIRSVLTDHGSSSLGRYLSEYFAGQHGHIRSTTGSRGQLALLRGFHHTLKTKGVLLARRLESKSVYRRRRSLDSTTS